MWVWVCVHVHVDVVESLQEDPCLCVWLVSFSLPFLCSLLLLLVDVSLLLSRLEVAVPVGGATPGLAFSSFSFFG